MFPRRPFLSGRPAVPFVLAVLMPLASEQQARTGVPCKTN